MKAAALDAVLDWPAEFLDSLVEEDEEQEEG